MSTPVAYFAIILIWSTTPLAIKWSLDIGTPIASFSARIALATTMGLLFLQLRRRPLRWHAAAVRGYAIAAIGMGGSLGLTYLAAPKLSSGLIALINGLGPLLTGVFNQLGPRTKRFRARQWFGCALGCGGLAVVFNDAMTTQPEQFVALCMVLAGVAILSASAVVLQHIGTPETPLNHTVGALLLVLPTLAVVALCSAAPFAFTFSARGLTALIYLAAIGSLLGLLCYYLLLARVGAAGVSLITLVTPVLALLLGAAINGERPGVQVWIGAVLIMVALAACVSPNPRGTRALRRHPAQNLDPIIKE